MGDQLDVECLEPGFINSELLSFGKEEEEEEEDSQYTIFSLKDKVPFLQMLQSVELEPPQLFTFKNPNFQTLLRLQHLNNNDPFMETQIQALELESCVTREALDLPSPVKSETNNDLKNNPHFSSSCFDVVSSEYNQNAENCSKNVTKSTLVARERRKRKRTKPVKNKEEVESQRMTHIAVERNRRRQMNDYLNSLRSLMPPSYIQRGDQASIIGGAIDFVKELEQLVQSMEAQKRMRTTEESDNNCSSNNSESKSAIEISQPEVVKGEAEIEVNVVQNHVNLKIQCERRPGQLVLGIVTLESLRLTVLHLNITSLRASVLYSFNLKMEDDCKLRSADEISATVHQIFS
ncbi:anthranilate N-methyltransferase-like [Hibiscus syriacus]|uniref:Anthranilate N-methyltransferase-like n=1 Tax=Hibiscus syriacus TaxID=106335 RepID=A0A6A3AXR4_HIBSY|nr:transcription factor bHLH70-like [Hibiscus syriacus]KAE8708673.1 anthranilate N-methyltransferase-like [Hibiscus syriacus]